MKNLRNFFNKNREDLLKLFLFIVTLVVMVGVTISICSSALIILNTQYRLFNIYTEIIELENQRTYNHDMAIASIGETRITFQEKSDAADAEIPHLYTERKKIENSNNLYVKFAARNGISVPMILIGFIPIISLVALWAILLYKYNYTKVIKWECMICKCIIRVLLLVLLLPMVILFSEH